MTTPFESFGPNIAAASYHISMYKELRKLKKLGARGRLDAANKYLLWAIRASVVASLSALDSYVHDKLAEQIPLLLGGPLQDIPEELAQLVSHVAPMKKPEEIRKSLTFVRSASGIEDLSQALCDVELGSETFQSPSSVEHAFKIMGRDCVFELVAALWQGPNSTAKQLKSRLDRYWRRRNQIAHESDLQEDGEPRPITPNYATDCVDFISALVTRLDAAA